MCQDTGTAIVMGKKGQRVWTGGGDEAALAEGVKKTYGETNLRYSQGVAHRHVRRDQYRHQSAGPDRSLRRRGRRIQFHVHGEGWRVREQDLPVSTNQGVVEPGSLHEFLDAQIRTLGTAACPPYHLAVVVGGTSAENNLKTVKLASARYLDNLPTAGRDGQAFRDLEWERKILEMTRRMGIGAQFGGKYFCHDVRVVRLPRHGASCPVGLGVSRSADRQILGRIAGDGVFLERLETHPAKYLPETTADDLGGRVVEINLDQPMPEVLRTLGRHPVKTRLSLTGSLIVARDIAHAKLKERLDSGEDLPQYFKDHAVYYAGPAKTPEGMPPGPSS